MKKLFILLALLGFIAVGCTEGGIEDETGQKDPTEQPGGGNDNTEGGKDDGENSGNDNTEDDDINDSNLPKPAANEIYYTSTDGLFIDFNNKEFFAKAVSSHTSKGNGVYCLTFVQDVANVQNSITLDFEEISTLKSIRLPKGITSIGEDTFNGCTSLTSITIPSSVTSIGKYAFNDCTSLTSITIPDSVTSIGVGAFANCTSLVSFYGKYASSDNRCVIIDGKLFAFAPAGLTKYTIPNNITSIEGAFSDCTSLTSVTIPDSVTEIGGSAFYGCTSLTSVTIGNGVTSIGDRAFCGCDSLTSITIPDSVTSIGSWAFYSCDSLTSVTIPNSVTSIGDWAFSYCNSLTSVTIGNGVTTIGSYAFGSCKKLTSVIIPNSVTSIGSSAFSSCKSLTGVRIGNSVTEIGEDAFHNCEALMLVYITDLSAWCKIDFVSAEANPLYNANNIVLNGTRVTDITIPSDITEIKSYTFCYAILTSVTIPDSVKTIGTLAFEGCLLKRVTIGNSVTEIGFGAFELCDLLTSVTIPQSVTSIERYAFYGCKSLKEVYCKPTTPPAGDFYMFDGNAYDRKIYVPTASVNAYKSASGWSTYKNYIVGYDIPDTPVDSGNGFALAGSFSEWGNVAMENNNGIYSAKGVTMEAYAELKIKDAASWDLNFGAATVAYMNPGNHIVVAEGGDNIAITEAGTYDVYFDRANLLLYVVAAGTDYTTAPLQSVNGKEPEVVAPEVTDTIVYLRPNSTWGGSDARFAAYFWNDNGNTWVSATDTDADGIYEIYVPTGYGTNIIFCRMKSGTTANSWINKQYQTVDLVIPTDGKNLFTVNEGEDGVNGVWSVK